MTKDFEKSSNFTRMTGDTDVLRLLRQLGIYLVEHLLAADFLINGSLPVKGHPQRVVLDEAFLECICGELFVNVCFAAPAIACMSTNVFPEELLHLRDERILLRQVQTLER